MAAFTDDATRIGIPVDWVHDHEYVPRLNVLSNSPALEGYSGMTSAEGRVEMWSNCYRTPESDTIGTLDHRQRRGRALSAFATDFIPSAYVPLTFHFFGCPLGKRGFFFFGCRSHLQTNLPLGMITTIPTQPWTAMEVFRCMRKTARRFLLTMGGATHAQAVPCLTMTLVLARSTEATCSATAGAQTGLMLQMHPGTQ